MSNIAETKFMVLAPQRHWWESLHFEEFWRYRSLIYFLTWRDVMVRYKQAILGIGWAVFQPALTVLTFSLFFGKLAKVPSDGVPYPVFSFAAMLPWTYFTTALGRGSNSLVSSGTLLSKVYFPRVIIPLSAVVAGLVDYFVTAALVFPFLIYHGFYPTMAWVVGFPLLTLFCVALAMGMSLLLSALNVRYRDVSYILPFFVQIWMFATPIVYPLSIVPEQYRRWMMLNPMAGVIEGFRSVLLNKPIAYEPLLYSGSVTAVILFVGLVYFLKTERSFADVV
jgi:lipopolysaccharide transport system permease protein